MLSLSTARAAWIEMKLGICFKAQGIEEAKYLSCWQLDRSVAPRESTAEPSRSFAFFSMQTPRHFCTLEVSIQAPCQKVGIFPSPPATHSTIDISTRSSLSPFSKNHISASHFDLHRNRLQSRSSNQHHLFPHLLSPSGVEILNRRVASTTRRHRYRRTVVSSLRL